jgi:pimeloyl-ACP methyl ester carboxylesterase
LETVVSFLDAYANSSYSAGAENPDLFNGWFFSYGTYIGQVFAMLFPERIGRVVLDGVVVAEDWVSGGDFSWIHADEAFTTFFVYCHIAGPSQCSYYTGSTPQDIFARFERTVSRLDPGYATQQGWANSSLINDTCMFRKPFISLLRHTTIPSA